MLLEDKTEIKPNVVGSEKLRFNSLNEWLAWQERLHFSKIELGLERCRRVASNMGLLKPSYTVVSVAGTNGKGSSVKMLSKILHLAGYRVGCYTSPHLIDYNERISINGSDVTDEKLCESFNRINAAREGISLTYFEFGTLAALDIFNNDVEIAVLEVGLGGRLDAVNILDADVSLITSIDLDHQKWLGYSRESIGNEKAGIFRGNVPAVCSDPNPPYSVIDYAEKIGTPLFVSGRDYFYEHNNKTWSWRYCDKELNYLPRPFKYSDFQLQNAAGVLMVLEKIKEKYFVSAANIKNSLNDFHLDGRMQFIQGDILTILDVAHNRGSVKALVENLENIPSLGKTHLVIGMLEDKEHIDFFRQLIPVVDTWNIVKLSHERASSTEFLVSCLNSIEITDNVRDFASLEDCLEDLEKTSIAGDRIVITGSFITVGTALKYLEFKKQ